MSTTAGFARRDDPLHLGCVADVFEQGDATRPRRFLVHHLLTLFRQQLQSDGQGYHFIGSFVTGMRAA